MDWLPLKEQRKLADRKTGMIVGVSADQSDRMGNLEHLCSVMHLDTVVHID
jgi:hypothetical protein